jgi:CubicO group peptidase (beta-lactamase class C family)
VVGFAAPRRWRAAADPLPRAKRTTSDSSERLDRIGQILRADVGVARIPGAVVVVARKGHIAYFDTVGFRDNRTPMPPDAIFRIASMTARSCPSQR